jgi:hypothetical protein
MTWHYARMQRSVFPAFDPLDRLREAVAGREAAGLRRRLVPRSPGDQGLDLASNATLTENDISLASRTLAVVREHCHHGRNTAQAGRNTT